MIRLVTFATADYSISAEKLKQSAYKNGVEEVSVYTPSHISNDSFMELLFPLLHESRGWGWWMWKPWVILCKIRQCAAGDYLIWSDAGTELVGNVQQVINRMDEDILLCSNGWQHTHWCKKEVAQLINIEDADNTELRNMGLNSHYYYEHHKQVQASFIIFKVTQKVIDFIQEWYAYSIMPGMIDNTPRGEQFHEFREHRHDQAILTCLQIKHGYKLNWFPSTYMHKDGFPEPGYQAILNHHRKTNAEW